MPAKPADRFSFGEPDTVRALAAFDEELYDGSFMQEWLLAAVETSDPEKFMNGEALGASAGGGELC